MFGCITRKPIKMDKNGNTECIRYRTQWRTCNVALAGIDIRNEPSLRVSHTVVIGLLTRNSSGDDDDDDEIANVNFLCDDILHALKIH